MAADLPLEVQPQSDDDLMSLTGSIKGLLYSSPFSIFMLG